MSPDRRGDPRKSTRFVVRYQASDGHDMEAEADQLGEKGLFIHSQSAAPVNSMLSLEITLPVPGPPIRGTATVVYSNPFRAFVPSALPPGMGVKFTILADSDRQRIVDFVNTLVQGGSDFIKVEGGKRPSSKGGTSGEGSVEAVDALSAAASAAAGADGGGGKRGKGSAPSQGDGSGSAPSTGSFFQRMWQKLNQPVGNAAEPAKKTAKVQPKTGKVPAKKGPPPKAASKSKPARPQRKP